MEGNSTPSSSRQVARASGSGSSKTPAVSLARQVVLDVSHQILQPMFSIISLEYLHNRKTNTPHLYPTSSREISSQRFLDLRLPIPISQLSNPKTLKLLPHLSERSPLWAQKEQDLVHQM